MRYFTFLFSFFYYSLGYAQEPVWLLVDTDNKIVQVKQGERTLELFEHISIARRGAGHKQRRGDDITPIGSYKISYSNNASHFRKFFELSYPSVEDAELGVSSGVISYAVYEAILFAHQNNQMPPQNTALGGHIGIHGVGHGNKRIHGLFDWTHGCIALSNRQIDRLAKWVYKGMRVQIK